jgi:hypothetical protein
LLVGAATPPDGSPSGMIASSTDRGASWTFQAVPPGTTMLNAISCGSATQCAVAAGASGGGVASTVTFSRRVTTDRSGPRERCPRRRSAWTASLARLRRRASRWDSTFPPRIPQRSQLRSSSQATEEPPGTRPHEGQRGRQSHLRTPTAQFAGTESRPEQVYSELKSLGPFDPVGHHVQVYVPGPGVT